MARVRGDNVQVWATVSAEISDEIDEMAERERRKKTEMVAVLIESAIKERKRKRIGKQNIKNESEIH